MIKKRHRIAQLYRLQKILRQHPQPTISLSSAKTQVHALSWNNMDRNFSVEDSNKNDTETKQFLWNICSFAWKLAIMMKILEKQKSSKAYYIGTICGQA